MPVQQAIDIAIACFALAIFLVLYDMGAPAYRDGCSECEAKQKSAGQNKSDQRKPPKAGGGGWAV